MTDIDTERQEISAFLESIDLPPDMMGGVELETVGGAAPAKPDFAKDGGQNVVVSNQLAGFSEDVPHDLRSAIANVMLLAELAADKKQGSGDISLDTWMGHYVGTLNKLGWRSSGFGDTSRALTGTSVEVHKAIVPVLTAVLGGAAVGVASTILSVLDGLKEMHKNQPWFTLFDRRTQRARANQFQISQVSMEGGEPSITLFAFMLDAGSAITQVLFFRFSSDEATLSHAHQKVSINPVLLKDFEARVTAKLSTHLDGALADIDI